ncbi:MAG: hypothetical protein GF344_07320 [Chitinivibrionales bacterium]|nr:hypothetical protein [Chitinivibrionales bacterium]MBD3356719.1 hypothetical protein [Chitinivibrionales bacterium]
MHERMYIRLLESVLEIFPLRNLNGEDEVRAMNRFSVVLVTVAASAHRSTAASLIEQIGWQGADWGVIVVFGVVIGAAVTALVFFHIRHQSKIARDAHSADERVFRETAERLGFSQAEVAAARNLIRRHPSPIRPQLLLQSITVFEKSVNLEMAELIGHNEDPRKLEEGDTVISSIRRKAGFMHVPLEHPLVSTRNISLGQTGAVFGRDTQTPLIQKASVSSRNERTLTLHYEVDQEEIVRLSPGDRIRFAFSRHNDGLYDVPLRIVNSDDAGNIVVYHTTELHRNQLRQYVRIEANLPVRFRLLQTLEPDKSEIPLRESAEGRMSDISGGGLSFLCEKSLKPGDLVSVNFALPNSRFAGVSCKILRISLQEGKTTTYYKHHAQFMGIEDRKRDAIVRYVFEKQRRISQWR